MTPSQIIHSIHGTIAHEDCTDVGQLRCWICGGSSTRGMLRTRWMGSNFTGQNRARCPSSDLVCEACVVVMSGRPPDTERMWSHLVEGKNHVRGNKGSKPVMREFLRRAHADPWFAAIADTGQKHIIPWCPINTPHQLGGRVLFEETVVELPRDEEGWDLLDAITEALTDGLTKEEISLGEYSSRAWQLLSALRLRDLESWLSRHRGGAWFDLAVWLAQRDEEKVTARMAAEKEAKRDEAQRKRKRETTNAPRGGRARTTRRVSQDARVQRPEALDDAAGTDAHGITTDDEPGGVVVQDDANAAVGGASGEQLPLLS